MRQLKRLTQRRPRRTPPPPRWKVFCFRTGALLLAASILAVSGWSLGRSTMLQDWTQQTATGLVGFLNDEGFVVSEAFTLGRERSDPKQIIRILEPYQMQSILLVDTVAIQRQLESLPWVRTASVKRSFPNELRIDLDEYRPIARWFDGRSERLLDGDGTVIDVEATAEFAHLPRVAGRGARDRLDEVWRLFELEPQLAARVTGATLVGQRRWNLELDNMVEVRLPSDDPEAAIRELARFEREERVLNRAVSAIDLRNPGWFVMQPIDDRAQSMLAGQPA